MDDMSLSIPFQILDNGVLAWGLAACGLAQLSKLVIELVVFRRWRPAVLIETGGMPSSHAALVSGTAAAVGWQEGFASSVFALSATVAFVVMYDASGVRRAAGFTAERVNALPESHWETSFEKPLKERLGHSRTEVLVGSLLGPTIALLGLNFLGSPLQLTQLITNALG
jgi:hypothetical protein